MNKCVICGKECKAECCSGACRAKKSRRTASKDIRQRTAQAHGLKRGKDIKCFADLSYDVQQAVDRISTDAEDKAKRTARAIHYQHLYPNKYLNKSTVTNYTMTDFEREHYRPVDQLAKGEFNPVSKPGDSHYTAQPAPGQEIRT